jgi:hypothetical protein
LDADFAEGYWLVLRLSLSLLVLFLFMSGGMLAGQTKRALLIGIDDYASEGKPRYKPLNVQKPKGQESYISRWDLPTWSNLDGAVNDVQAMKELLLSAKFGFSKDEPYMHVLTNREATRDSILKAMLSYLVEKPSKGDVVVFYYAGHGSQRYNSQTSKPEHLDETIVPSNANTGQFDIRDKEIRRIFNQALDKGVKLTAIFDSCHSGSIARGMVMGKVRYLAYDPRDANDPDDKTVAPEDRQDNAALVFTATQHDQLANEFEGLDGKPHGSFTVALIEALEELPANTRAADVYKRVKTVMEGRKEPWTGEQEPALGGTSVRPRDALLGVADVSTRLRVAVAREAVRDDGRIVLDGGRITGIGPGSELVKLTSSKNAPEVRIRIAWLEGLNKSVADRLDRNSEKVETGDLFELRKWLPAERSQLKLWTAPATLSAAELEAMAAEVSKLYTSPKISWVEDPATSSPAYIISWSGSEWTLGAVGGNSQSLGTHPTADKVTERLGASQAHARLFVDFPPSRELAAQLKLGTDSAIAATIVAKSRDAQYLLAGRVHGATLEYAWVAREVIENGETASDRNSSCSPNSPYPLRSDWIPASAAGLNRAGVEITDMAAQLAKVKAWLELKAPPSGGIAAFPYQLVFKHRGSAGLNFVDERGTVKGGEEFDLVLYSLDKLPAVVDRQWVYVLGIDCSGAGQLLFPLQSEGNHLPEEPVSRVGSEVHGYPQEINLTAGNGVKIGPPFGMDTYILLTTSEPLPDPGMLNFDAVLSRGAKGRSSPLAELLGSASAGMRGVSRESVPADWNIQILHTLSVPGPSPGNREVSH